MSVNFEFDGEAFRHAIEDAASEGIRHELLPELQAKLDDIQAGGKGRPPAELAARLLNAFSGEPDTPNTIADVMPYAEAISAGHWIELQLGDPIW